MSNPKQHVGAEVDPSEGAIEEGEEQQSFQAADNDGQDSAALNVDPSEGAIE